MESVVVFGFQPSLAAAHNTLSKAQMLFFQPSHHGVVTNHSYGHHRGTPFWTGKKVPLKYYLTVWELIFPEHFLHRKMHVFARQIKLKKMTMCAVSKGCTWVVDTPFFHGIRVENECHPTRGCPGAIWYHYWKRQVIDNRDGGRSSIMGEGGRKGNWYRAWKSGIDPAMAQGATDIDA